MHVTSDYYRGRGHAPEAAQGLVECWIRSIARAQRAQSVEPLCPSTQTLRRLAAHYENNHALKRSA
jgi:hypothetical protein